MYLLHCTHTFLNPYLIREFLLYTDTHIGNRKEGRYCVSHEIINTQSSAKLGKIVSHVHEIYNNIITLHKWTTWTSYCLHVLKCVKYSTERRSHWGRRIFKKLDGSGLQRREIMRLEQRRKRRQWPQRGEARQGQGRERRQWPRPVLGRKGCQIMAY